MSNIHISGLGLQDRNYNSFGQYSVPVVDGVTGSPAVFRIMGGLVTSGGDSFTHGDAAPFMFGTDGKLLVDTELTLSGVEINNIKVYSTDGSTGNVKYGKVDSNGVVYINPWNGTQGATTIDNTAQSGTPALINIGGVAVSGVQTYANNDAAIMQMDTSGRVMTRSLLWDTVNTAEVKTPNGSAFLYGLHTMPARYMATIPSMTDTYSSPLLLGSKGQLLTNIYDGTAQLTLGTATVKTLPCAVHDGTTLATVTTGTIKALNVAISDGTTQPTVTTGTIKGLNTVISDGTTVPTVGTGTQKGLYTHLTDGTTIATVTSGTIKGLNAVISDGTTQPTVTTGTIKGLNVVLSDGTTAPTVTTGTIKSLNVAINDGTTQAVVDTSSTGLLVTNRQNVTAVAPAALDLTAALEADRTWTSTFTKAWEISRIQILFSTAQSRNITIYNYDGTNLFTEHADTGDTSLTYVYPAQYAWFGTATDEIRIVFSQALAACTATIRVIYKDA